jgi:cell division protein FtsA
MRELFELAAERLERGGWHSLLAGGIVLTGGGSLLDGVTELAQEVFGLPVRIGEPMTAPGSPHELRNPMYATLVGLVLHALQHHRTTAEPTPSWRRWWHRLLQRVKNLWR